MKKRSDTRNLQVSIFTFFFFLGASVFAQTAEIRVIPPANAPPQALGTTTTTVVTTTTTTAAPNADGTAGEQVTQQAAPQVIQQSNVNPVTSAIPATSAFPNVVPTFPSMTAPAPVNIPGAQAWVDDGSMDTRSQVERARQNLRNSMANDPWLAASVNKISVSADGESLTLTGMVNHSQERDAIERIARENSGSLRLINSIRVR